MHVSDICTCIHPLYTMSYSITIAEVVVFHSRAINKVAYFDYETYLSFFTRDRNGASLSSTSVTRSGSKSLMLKVNSILTVTTQIDIIDTTATPQAFNPGIVRTEKAE